jgi:hypothetical protein
MIALARRVVAVTAGVIALGAFGAPANADSAGGPTRVVQPGRGEISGKISFAEAVLPYGFNSKVCRTLHVLAENASRSTTYATSGKMSAKLKGTTVRCSYTIQGLSAGSYVAIPSGKPPGVPLCTGFSNPAGTPVTLRAQPFNQVSSASNVNFNFVFQRAENCGPAAR